ncbi:serine carboxypeptidase [Echria macrotheca]|uniref:Serine carboxypeptidase n=1 Tax=Echria macrotheca TaxID=438768 RepID=A0AAJ0BF71_9PEZI|nr:serine carboxypeptidase [Echria macrotheca]
MHYASIILAGFVGTAVCHFPPKPEGVKVLKSKFHENVTISYKQPGICETTPGVKSYAGYVHLPPGFLDDAIGEPQDYPINTFFWFFEARKNPSTAPLAIWLNGGPGGSSIMGLLEENGPCFVTPDSKSTVLNPWSWNNEVNMLYIDQPNQVGFSYDVPTNATFSPQDFGFLSEPADFSDGVPETNMTFMVGTVSSGKPNSTAHSTAQAAHALWHFAQTWFFEFPHYKPEDDRISLWTESYGGHYGPGFMRFFQERNERIDRGGSEEEGAHKLHLDVLGIVNGCVDFLVQGEDYFHYGFDNPYGIPIFNKSTYESLLHSWRHSGGLKDQFYACRAAIDGSFANVSTICNNVLGDFLGVIDGYVAEANAGSYDITHPLADPFPPPYLYGYLTEESVLGALGVPVNYTPLSIAVNEVFTFDTYDVFLGGFIESLGALLDGGVKVHMVYGDSDYACNWLGGETISLAIPHSSHSVFASAGYTPLMTSDLSSPCGFTRQHANLSFTRVFNAGHEVPSYQPEAAYEIFMRATRNVDIATGTRPVTEDLVTDGMKDVRGVKVPRGKEVEPRCYILKRQTCTDDVWERVLNGKAEVRDWFVVGDGEEEGEVGGGQEWGDL